MCRHLAYLGPPIALHELLYASPCSLYAQSYAPREQHHGTVNADGFGVGWYPLPGSYVPDAPSGPIPSPEPLRYRRSMPIWADASFADAAKAIHASCVVAAVRDATPGCGMDESCAQPFRGDRWLFSHNGAAIDAETLTEYLAAPSPSGVLDARTPVDSAPLFAHAMRLWRKGAQLDRALVDVVRAARSCSPGRYNLLACDGQRLAATVVGDTLYTRHYPDTTSGGVCIASEPIDDDPGWHRVPDDSLVVADRAGITHIALDTESGEARC